MLSSTALYRVDAERGTHEHDASPARSATLLRSVVLLTTGELLVTPNPLRGSVRLWLAVPCYAPCYAGLRRSHVVTPLSYASYSHTQRSSKKKLKIKIDLFAVLWLPYN